MTTPKADREPRPISPVINTARNNSTASLNTALNKNFEKAKVTSISEGSSTARHTPSTSNSSQVPTVMEEQRNTKTLGRAPKPFTGRRSDTETFINDMDIYVELNPSLFPTDNVKVLTMTLYLEGDAKDWLKPYLKDFREHDTPEDDT